MTRRFISRAIALFVAAGVGGAAAAPAAACPYGYDYRPGYGCAAAGSPFGLLLRFLAYGLFHHRRHHEFAYEGYGGGWHPLCRGERHLHAGTYGGWHALGRFGGARIGGEHHEARVAAGGERHEAHVAAGGEHHEAHAKLR